MGQKKKKMRRREGENKHDKIDEYTRKYQQWNNKKTISINRRSKTFTKTITAIGLKSMERNELKGL